MKITFWGVRGSIPSPGKDKIKYGGHTTTVEVITKSGDLIIIDAGTALKDMAHEILKREIQPINFILTHSHWDHIFGFPFFSPAYFSKYNINVYGCPFASKTLKNMVAHIWQPPFFPIPFYQLKANFNLNTDKCFKKIEIGSVTIESILLNHPNLGYGYKFTEDGKTFVFLTDNELSHTHRPDFNVKEYIDFTEGADILVHDAQYDNKEYEITKGWGHSTFEDAVNFALKSNVKQLGLCHHDYDHTDKQMDNYVKECCNMIYSKNSKIPCFAIENKMVLTL